MAASAFSATASLAIRPVRTQHKPSVAVRTSPVCMASSAAEVPDINKRNTMNLILAAGAALPVAAMGGPYLYFFYPASSGGGGAGTIAKDAVGNEVTSKKWLETHLPGDHSLVQVWSIFIKTADAAGIVMTKTLENR